MKQFIKLSLLTFALLGLSVLVPVSVSANLPAPEGGSGSSQTTKQARACYNKYDGHGVGRGTDNKFTGDLAKDYKKSKCDVAKGGNCRVNGSSQGGIVSCEKPKATSGGTGGGSNDCSGECSPDEIVDPAVDCSSDDCDIIAKYVNPLINLLSVLVGIAIVIGIIIGGIQVSTSAGDPQKAANGKNHIRNALIALVGYILLFLILNWIVPGGVL